MKKARLRLAKMSDEDILKYREWFLQSDPPRLTCRPVREASAEEMAERFRGIFDGEKGAQFGVRRNEDDVLVGRVTYFDLNPRNRSAEIGYLIAPEFRGKGYAGEALSLLLHYLFGELHLNKVTAQTAEFNKESVKLLRKLGFKQDGRLREHHVLDRTFHDDLVFSILSGEFEG
jgi:ribosomal-protein-alanine N-acetyltransferase